MCEPATISLIIGGVVGAITSITSAAVAGEQEKAMIEAENEANIANANMIIDESNDFAKQEGIQEQSEMISASNEATQLKIDNMQREGTHRAKNMAEGNASQIVKNEYARVLGQNVSQIEQNLRLSKANHQNATGMYYRSANNQIKGLRETKQTNPAIFAAQGLLGVGQSAVSATNKYYDRKNKGLTE